MILSFKNSVSQFVLPVSSISKSVSHFDIVSSQFCSSVSVLFCLQVNQQACESHLHWIMVQPMK